MALKGMITLWGKFIAGFLIVSMCLSSIFPASEAFAGVKAEPLKRYKDVAEHKYEEALNFVINNDLMNSRDEYIRPDARLSKGEACLSLNALLGASKPFNIYNFSI